MASQQALQHQLSELILDHGEEICLDHRAVQRALAEAFPERPALAVAAHVATREGVAFDLSQDRSPELPQMLFERLVGRLVTQAGLDPDFAASAIQAWAGALGRHAPELHKAEPSPPITRPVSDVVVNHPLGPARSLRGHKRRVNSVRFSPSGTKVAACSSDRSLRIWETRTGATHSTLLGGHREPVNALAFSSNGERLLSGGADGALRLWNPRSSERLNRLMGHDEPVLCADLSHDGELAVSGSLDGTVCIWSLDELRILKRLGPYPGGVRDLRLIDGLLIFSAQGRVEIWDQRGDKRLRELPAKGLRPAISPGHAGRLLVGDDSGLSLWDIRDGQEKVRYEGFQGTVSCAALHPNGKVLAAGAADQSVRIFSLRQPRETWRFETGRLPTCLDFHPEGHLAMGFDQGDAELRDMTHQEAT